MSGGKKGSATFSTRAGCELRSLRHIENSALFSERATDAVVRVVDVSPSRTTAVSSRRNQYR